MSIDIGKDACERYLAAVKILTEWPARLERAQELRAQAVSYVWGWQDAGGEVKDSDRASAFGWAYGTVAALCELGRIGSRPPIQDAWQSWVAHGEVRDYSGRALDQVAPEPVGPNPKYGTE